MADVLSGPSIISAGINRAHDNFGRDALYSRSSMYTAPEPNPPFVFPLQAATPDARPSEQDPTKDSKSTRRSTNRSRPQNLSISALPSFDFNPSSTGSASTLSGSLDRSPTNNTSFPSHVSGHRRNGSEFIGGDSRSGGFGLMSTSPTKGEGALPTPNNTRPPASGSKRGHAHRRSDAVSNHDISMILKPSRQPRGSSAPTTPSIPANEPDLPEFERTKSQPITTLSIQRSPGMAKHRGSASFEGPSRPRVGFSDTIEFIPRPLSTISSETSSSLSTIRANHSGTGSITSIISASTSSPPSAKTLRSALETTFEMDPSQARPKTAGPTLSTSRQEHPFREDNEALHRPSSASAADHFSTEFEFPPIDSRYRIASQSESNLPIKDAELSQTSANPENQGSDLAFQASTPPSFPASNRPRTAPEPKIMKGQKKVKFWADSILLRRTKPRDTKEEPVANQLSVPPLQNFAPGSELSLENINFDDDTSCVIQTPPADIPTPTAINTDTSVLKPPVSSPVSDSDGSTSMLDLDAELESPNRPRPEADASDAGVRCFSSARYRMHSSGVTGGFSGPGMHYHRRTESAPEMAAINHHTFGFPRLSSNPAMADVFEEEEEETNVIYGEEPPEDYIDPGLGIEIVNEDCTDFVPKAMRRRLRDSLTNDEISFDDRDHLRPSPTNSKPESMLEAFDTVEIANAEEEPRFSVVTKSSDESTVTPSLFHDPFLDRPASAPIDYCIQKPALVYTTPESSCVSSPDFSRFSSDAPRMHTANSSITDRATLSSSRTYDYGRSIHDSADDVPSLISGASTANSAHGPRLPKVISGRLDGDRPSTLPAAMPRKSRHGNSGKRSSLVSLGRLVSYGEKSKLNIEERAQPDDKEKIMKKKGNRISRLMKFWKSKEKSM